MPKNRPLRAIGALASVDASTRRAILTRSASESSHVREQTRAIIDAVAERGDAALIGFAHRFDGATLTSLSIPRNEWTRALDALDPALRRAMERARDNIRTVHAAFLPTAQEVSPEAGIHIGRRPDPLARVGVYAPGGRASYPSSLFMGAIPARVAGVAEVIVCSPPTPSGLPSEVVLAAAALAEVDALFAVGGAGAIAAMALGTASIPRVDRIVGPGNAHVAEAKLQLVSKVAIDSPAGPSELLVIADGTAPHDVVAREMVAQAEHDPDAAVIALLVDADEEALARLAETLSREAAQTPRAEVVQRALAQRGAILSCASYEEAIAFANEWAAEHLLIAVAADWEERVLNALRGAGTIFVGESASVTFGDYMTGANHVLPTAGLARCYSGLSTLDFVRWTTWQRITPAAAASLSADVDVFARAEGLPAHAAAARAWGNAS